MVRVVPLLVRVHRAPSWSQLKLTLLPRLTLTRVGSMSEELKHPVRLETRTSRSLEILPMSTWLLKYLTVRPYT